MVNEEMIRIVVKRIERDLEHWDQKDWGALLFPDISQDQHEADYYAEIEDRTLEVHKEWKLLDTDRYGDWVQMPETVKCNTAMCFAGHTVSEAGFPMVYRLGEPTTSTCINPQTGELLAIEATAAEILGLDYNEAETLFDGDAGKGGLEKFKQLITDTVGVEFD